MQSRPLHPPHSAEDAFSLFASSRGGGRALPAAARDHDSAEPRSRSSRDSGCAKLARRWHSRSRDVDCLRAWEEDGRAHGLELREKGLSLDVDPPRAPATPDAASGAESALTTSATSPQAERRRRALEIFPRTRTSRRDQGGPSFPAVDDPSRTDVPISIVASRQSPPARSTSRRAGRLRGNGACSFAPRVNGASRSTSLFYGPPGLGETALAT